MLFYNTEVISSSKNSRINSYAKVIRLFKVHEGINQIRRNLIIPVSDTILQNIKMSQQNFKQYHCEILW